MKSVYDVIVRPLVTESSMENAQAKKYSFEVRKDATKAEIRKAVETVFGNGIEVKRVNTSIVKPKPKRMGVHEGYTSAWKKAVVTLTESSKTITFFDSMM